jgi:hypothetical protein
VAESARSRSPRRSSDVARALAELADGVAEVRALVARLVAE